MIFLRAILLAALVAGAAQGQQFYSLLRGANEVPPNKSAGQAYAQFSLNGNVLTYSVWIPWFWVNATSVGIYGPARPGQIGDLISLTQDEFDNEFPFPPIDPGGVSYLGDITVTEQQKSNLLAGLVYVNITSSGFPVGEIRGQISRKRPPLPSHLNGRVFGALGLSPTVYNSSFGSGFGYFPFPPVIYVFSLRAKISVLTESGALVATALSNASGDFSIAVPAGNYRVVAYSPLFPGQALVSGANPGPFASESFDFVFGIPGRTGVLDFFQFYRTPSRNL